MVARAQSGNWLSEGAGPAARKIERQLALDDQLFQKLVRNKPAPGSASLHGERDFERRELAEVQIGAEAGGGVGRRFVLLAGVTAQLVAQKIAQAPLRRSASAKN